jgi:hypothetical protein
MKPARFKMERKLIAQVRYYEELYVITDLNGEKIFVGNPETAKKYLKILNAGIKRSKRK